MRTWLLLGLAALLLPGAASAKAKGPRFYFELRGVQVPAGEKADLKEQARIVLLAELKKHPELVTELATPNPTGDELVKQLKARRLEGFAIVLRVVTSKHELRPPAAGKLYKQLMVEVAVAIDAEKIPSGQMALAGEGSAEVGTEVKKVNEKERLQLRAEALADAIKQAVGKTVVKLGAPAPKASKRKKR